MKYVVAHQRNINCSVDSLNQDIIYLTTKSKESLRLSTNSASSDAVTAISDGAFARSIDENVVARRLLSIGVDYAVAGFLAFQHPEQPIEFAIEGEIIQTRGADRDCVKPTPIDWFECVGTALCLRRSDAIRVLSSFSVDNFQPRWDSFWKSLCVSVQRFLQGDPSWATLAAEATNLVEHSRTETIKTINRFMSILPTLHAIAARNQTAFTDALVQMLQAHKAQASRGQERNTGLGHLAIHACGMAALGLDHGLMLEVESDYLPTWFVKNEVP